jgi:hypothetical protein
LCRDDVREKSIPFKNVYLHGLYVIEMVKMSNQILKPVLTDYMIENTGGCFAIEFAYRRYPGNDKAL